MRCANEKKEVRQNYIEERIAFCIARGGNLGNLKIFGLNLSPWNFVSDSFLIAFIGFLVHWTKKALFDLKVVPCIC